jgi:hypothetical protein
MSDAVVLDKLGLQALDQAAVIFPPGAIGISGLEGLTDVFVYRRPAWGALRKNGLSTK